MPVITGAAVYPENILEKLSAAGVAVTAVDALSLAREAGNQKAVNVVLIGVLAASSDIPEADWIAAVRSTVPEKLQEINLKAFALGYSHKNKEE